MKILLAYGRHYSLQLTQKENCHGNSPLHEAVMIRFKDGVQCLFSDDQSATHRLNKEGQSPLYVAARNGYTEILKILMEAPVDDIMLSKMQRGNSPLHAVIVRNTLEIGKEVMGINKKFFESKDKNGSNPLHWAVGISGKIRLISLIRTTNPKCELQGDNNGVLPIHLACQLGNVNAVAELLKPLEWPDPVKLVNDKGQNILHVAAQYGKEEVISSIINRTKSILNLKHEEMAKNVLNAKDNDGNTPLHLATRHQNPKAVFTLLWNGDAELNLTNNQGLQPADLIFYHSAAPLTTRQMITYNVLYSVNAVVRPDIKSRWVKLWLEPKPHLIKDNINLLLIIATLIATVTFAAGFTMPGGSIQSGQDDAGLPVFMNETMFRVFVCTDAIAFHCSIGSLIITLLYSQVPDKYLGSAATSLIWLLLAVAVCLMSLSFMASLSLAMKKSGGVKAFVVLLESGFLLCFFSPVIASTPFSASRGYMRYLHYYIIINVMMAISGSFSLLNTDKKTYAIEESKESEAPPRPPSSKSDSSPPLPAATVP